MTNTSGAKAASFGVRGVEPKWCATPDKGDEFQLSLTLRQRRQEALYPSLNDALRLEYLYA
ncbi:hypothetical protein [Sphingobium algorifonticola]|uniref:Uncharacterized protein n=1 Tax=Sphingobium algorifonticola TaxID=2008318 RepID=A0A437J4U6_9SPHN|nr:hypothetical protein [Sphingobium algorifonticola]RVT39779.1 hypothetical protein ENE74_13575 [Sphingobium algorifonticola]